MDNLFEISPEVVLFTASDFPRHWKPFIIYMRSTFSRHETIFILLINDSFSTEEANKAEHLDVNAVLDEDLTSQQTVERVRGIITRYHQKIDIRRANRYLPSRSDRIHCAFTNPYTFQIVSGRVVDISSGGVRIEPRDRAISESLDPHSVVSMASLQLGENVLPVKLRVVRAAETIACEFIDLAVETDRKLSEYIIARADRDIAGTTSESAESPRYGS
jgi:hypothetical protein